MGFIELLVFWVFENDFLCWIFTDNPDWTLPHSVGWLNQRLLWLLAVVERRSSHSATRSHPIANFNCFLLQIENIDLHPDLDWRLVKFRNQFFERPKSGALMHSRPWVPKYRGLLIHHMDARFGTSVLLSSGFLLGEYVKFCLAVSQLYWNCKYQWYKCTEIGIALYWFWKREYRTYNWKRTVAINSFVGTQNLHNVCVCNNAGRSAN
jgi:hypothetical protein